MGLMRISTKDGITIEVDGKEAHMTKVEVDAKVGRGTQAEDEIVRQLGKSLGKRVFFHKNRSGSTDVYTGKVPDVFPEDVERPK